jgi:hypothetical protein
MSPDAFGRRMTLQQKIYHVGREIKIYLSSNVPRKELGMPKMLKGGLEKKKP